MFAAGAVSSFLTMFFGATGSFIAALLKGMKLPPLAHVATQGALMTLQHLLKSVVFGFLGFAFASWLPLIAAMIASGFLGTVIGRQVLTRMGPSYFLDDPERHPAGPRRPPGLERGGGVAGGVRKTEGGPQRHRDTKNMFFSAALCVSLSADPKATPLALGTPMA